MQSIILELLANVMDILVWTMLFNRRFFSKYNNRYTTIGFILVGLSLESVPIIWDLPFYPTEIIMIAYCIVYLHFFRQGQLLHKIFWVVLSFVLIFAIAFTAMPIISRITGVSAEVILTPPNFSHRALYLAVVNIIKFSLFFIVSSKPSIIQNNSKAFLFCLLIPIISIISGVWIFTFFARSDFQHIYDNIVILIAGSYLLINLLSFILYDMMERDAEEKMYLVAQKSHYETMGQYTEQIKETNREIRVWQHDMKQHLNCMKELISKNDYSGAVKYLEKFTDNVKGSYLKISTGNYIADAVLSSKINIALKSGITFDCEASLPDVLPIDEVDFCSILSNILENAIEACEKNVDNRYIKCNIETIKNQLIIEVENSSNGKYRIHNGFFESQKKGGLHGMGLKHTQSIIEKYDGICSIKAEEDIFFIGISIPLKTE